MEKKIHEESHQRDDYKDNPLKVVFKKSIKKNRKVEPNGKHKTRSSQTSKKHQAHSEVSAFENLLRMEDSQPQMNNPVFSDPKKIHLIYGDLLVPDLTVINSQNLGGATIGPQIFSNNQNTVVRMLSQFNKFKHITNVSLEKTSDFIVISLEDIPEIPPELLHNTPWQAVCERLATSGNSDAVELGKNLKEYCESVESTSVLMTPTTMNEEEPDIEKKGRDLRESMSENVALLLTSTKKDPKSPFKVTELAISRKLQELVCEDVDTLPALITGLGLPDIVVCPNPLATLNTILSYYLRNQGTEAPTELALNTEEGRTLKIKALISASTSINRNDLIVNFIIEDKDTETLRVWRNSKKKEDRIKDTNQTTMKIENESQLNEWEKLITSYYPKVQVDLPVIENSEKVCKYRSINK